jgi:hypothetical protein
MLLLRHRKRFLSRLRLRRSLEAVVRRRLELQLRPNRRVLWRNV